MNSWFDDPNDTELKDIIPFMKKLAETNDIYSLLNYTSAESNYIHNSIEQTNGNYQTPYITTQESRARRLHHSTSS